MHASILNGLDYIQVTIMYVFFVLITIKIAKHSKSGIDNMLGLDSRDEKYETMTKNIFLLVLATLFIIVLAEVITTMVAKIPTLASKINPKHVSTMSRTIPEIAMIFIFGELLVDYKELLQRIYNIL